MTAVLCVCGHPQGRHLLARRDCKSCPDCTTFRPVESEPVDVTVLLGEVQAEAGREAELTAEVERLRRELADAVEHIPCGWCDGVGVAPGERFGRDADGAPNVDEDRPCPEGCEVPAWLQAERNDAADDARLLAAAQQEAEKVRALLAQAEDRCRQIQDEDLPEAIAAATQELRAELDLARLTVGDLRQNEITRARLLRERGEEITSLRDRLKQAEEYSRDLQDQLPAGERLYDTHVRYLCPVCGGRYREFHPTHPCARLVPVRVRITFIEE